MRNAILRNHLNPFDQDLKVGKVASPEESGRIVTHENVPFPVKITKEGAQILRMKMRDTELCLKEAAVYIYGFYLPA